MMKIRYVWIAVLILAVAALVVWRVSSRPAPAPTVSAEGYAVWSPAYLKSAMKKKDFVLVNVHTPQEGSIPGTDLEIPYDQIAANLARLPQDRTARIVLYCRSGRMSEIAATQLTQMGFTHVASLQGGMLGWSEAGGKLEN